MSYVYGACVELFVDEEVEADHGVDVSRGFVVCAMGRLIFYDLLYRHALSSGESSGIEIKRFVADIE